MHQTYSNTLILSLMKFIFISISFLLLTKMVYCQKDSTDVDGFDLHGLQQTIHKEAENLRHDLEAKEGNDKEIDAIMIEFKLDTFVIERLLDRRMAIGGGPSMVQLDNATSDAARAYEKLIDKYYQILLSRMKSEDKPILEESQKIWVKYNECESKLHRKLVDEEYDNHRGGSLLKYDLVAQDLERNKNRVIELYKYIVHDFNN